MLMDGSECLGFESTMGTMIPGPWSEQGFVRFGILKKDPLALVVFSLLRVLVCLSCDLHQM